MRWYSLAFLVLLGCSDPTSSATPVSIAGVWDFHMADGGFGDVECIYVGKASFTQSGASFTGLASGTVACTGTGQDGSDMPFTIQLINGKVTGSDFEFASPSCYYKGTAMGTPLSLSGTRTCPYTYMNEQGNISGSWTATH
jgi:hypothetical protein